MNNMTNHYETLNVASDASIDSIRASYHSLYKMFHPNLNPDMQDGLLMINELNKAFEVLKDPNSRGEYDLQFRAQRERKSSRLEGSIERKELPPPFIIKEEPKAVERREASTPRQQENSSSSKLMIASAVAVIAVIFISFSYSGNKSSRIGMMDLSELVSPSKYVRPELSPVGSPFPQSSSYVSGYELRNNDGHSSLLVDNLKNENDVFLKLVSTEGKKVSAVRHVLIKAKSDFLIENLSAGQYEVQYLDLVAGQVGKSESFLVSETKTEIGYKSSSLSVKLQTAIKGSLKVETVPMEAFNSLASL